VTFSHDVQHSLDIVVDLVNSAPESAGQELVPDVDALRAFVAEHTISDVGPLNRDDLSQVQALRLKLRDVFVAASIDEASSLVNDLLAKARLCPRLTNHDDYAWHIHYFAPGATLAEHLLTDGGMALAFVVVAGEHERLRVCAAHDCDRVLVDLSRNRSKRYCDSRTCGNRLHVAAYRERRRAAG
jgi:predicted RNA-binding Zn ribbon-like protein